MGIQVSFMLFAKQLDISLTILDAVIHWSLLGIMVFGLINTFSFYHPRNYQLLIVLAAPVLLVGIWEELSAFIFNALSTADSGLWMAESLPFRITMAYLLLAGAIGFSLMWYRLEERSAAEKREQEIERMAKEAELFKLRQQIQPHFLFNALNSINSLIGSRPKDARKMTQNLSEFLRGSLKREHDDMLTLEEEINHLNLYLDLEQVRFGHRLQIERSVQEECLSEKLPSLLIQPLIENAIKYGLYGTIGDLVIELTCKLEQNRLRIEVRNPFEEGSSDIGGTGFGLPSIKRRLYLIYGRTDLLQTRIENGIFIAQLSIPKSHV